MAWTFAKFYVALNHGLEYQLLEVSLHLVVNLVGKTKTTIVHGEKETLYFEFRIKFALNNLDSVEEFADSLKGEVFALHRYYHRVGSSQGINCDKTQRRRAVDENIVVVVSDRSQQLLYYLFTVFDIQHFYFCAYKVDMAWYDVESVDISSIDSVSYVGVVNDTFIERAVYFCQVYTQS